MRVIQGPEDLRSLAGEELGVSDWLQITQERVDTFAQATDDRQWIHVDRDRAANGPFGGTIAHGYLTLSLIPYLSSQVFSFQTSSARLNYGLNKVRFPNPLRVGSRIRDRVVVGAVTDVAAGTQVTLRHTVEIEGYEKPACVAEAVVLLLS